MSYSRTEQNSTAQRVECGTMRNQVDIKPRWVQTFGWLKAPIAVHNTYKSTEGRQGKPRSNRQQRKKTDEANLEWAGHRRRWTDAS